MAWEPKPLELCPTCRAPVRDKLPRAAWLTELHRVRAVCFGDGGTQSGAVRGEHDRAKVADALNGLQAVIEGRP